MRIALIGATALLASAAVVTSAQTTTQTQTTAQTPAPATTQAPPPAPAPPPMSPRGTAGTQVAGTWAKVDGRDRYTGGRWITIDYGRPVLRGRTSIFGTGADYGKVITGNAPVWRAGANETTHLTTEVPLVIGGQTIPAGTYSVFVELKENAWTLVLSTQASQIKYDRTDKSGTWGSYNFDPKFEIVRAPMKLLKSSVSVEQFTIGFVNMTQQGGTLAMWWDKEFATVDFTVGS